ncbi:MAG: hypothetical protein U5L06_00940 [Rhodovibrio sp.]|nr:hypothetical protein [Rhodovibrio sp.]
MNLSFERLLLGKRRHDLERIAQDHAVGPVPLVLVEFQLGVLVALKAVEVREHVGFVGLRLALGGGAAAQVLDDRLGVNLLLDVDRHGVDLQAAAVLLVLAAPDQLRVQVRFAAVELRVFVRVVAIAVLGHRRLALVLTDQPLQLGRGNVGPRRLPVAEGFDFVVLFWAVERRVMSLHCPNVGRG